MPTNKRCMSAIEYQPIGTISGRCLSASYTHASASKDVQLKVESLSLPGQLDVELDNIPKFSISPECTKRNNETDTLQDENRTPIAAGMGDSDSVSTGTLSHQSNSHRNTTSNRNKLLTSHKVQPAHINSSPTSIEEDISLNSLSQTSLEVQSVLRQAREITWAEDTTSTNHASPLKQRSTDDVHMGLPNRRNIQSQFSLKKCTKAFLCLIVALTVYPILIVLVPLLLVVKLLAVLLCCIPCFKHQRETIPQMPPHFFKSEQGGFYTTLVVLKERMTSKKFVDCFISKLKNAYECDHNETFASQLASQAQNMCCISWRERLDKVELDQHISILDRQISTNNDLSNFLASTSKNNSTNSLMSKEWMVYFIEKYKSHSSAIVFRAHHSFIRRTLPANSNLIRLFTTSKIQQSTDQQYEPPQVSAIVKVLLGPGIVLSNMLKFSRYRLLGSRRLSGQQSFTLSEPISLTRVKQMINDCDISVYSLFLSALTEAFKHLLRSQNKSLHNITIAIPVHHGSAGQVSAFFVVLPVTQRRQSQEKLLRYFERQLLVNQGDAQIFLSAMNVASHLLFPCSINHFTSLVVKQASGIFNIIDCSTNPLYFDESYVISSVAFWPPLFSRFRIGLSVLCYDNTFRVCVVSDRNLTEWPDLFLGYYLNALFTLCSGDF